MLYTLLNAVSSVVPMATPTLTATPIPTPTASPLPVFVSIIENTADKPGFWEIAGILSSVILGVVALVVSINAYRFAKQQQKREEELRQREAKISVLDKAFEIYNYFVYEAPKYLLKVVVSFDEESEQVKKQSQIDYFAKIIFKEETYTRINNLICLVLRTKKISKMPQTSTPEQSKDSFERIYVDYNLSKYNIKSEQEHMGAIIICVVNFIHKEINDIYMEYKLKL